MSETKTIKAYIALGANLGDAINTLQVALQALQEHAGIYSVQSSSFYRTAPIDSSGPDYINAVAEVLTDLSPQNLWKKLQKIEQTAGRERPYRNAPRTLDLDILLYGDLTISTPELTIAHPRMWQRAFVLHPLSELAPHLVSALQLKAVSDQVIEKISPLIHTR